MYVCMYVCMCSFWLAPGNYHVHAPISPRKLFVRRWRMSDRAGIGPVDPPARNSAQWRATLAVAADRCACNNAEDEYHVSSTRGTAMEWPPPDRSRLPWMGRLAICPRPVAETHVRLVALWRRLATPGLPAGLFVHGTASAEVARHSKKYVCMYVRMYRRIDV